MVIDVKEWYSEDGKLKLTISWDENDPVESKFNDWTEDDFLTAIRNACEQELPVGGEILPDEDFGMYSTPDT